MEQAVAAEQKQMTFAAGEVNLRSVSRRHTTWAGGAPHSAIVLDGQVQRLVPVSFPQVDFTDHRYSTKNPAIARALVLDESNFEPNGKWGWRIDPSSIPRSLVAIYNRVSRTVKRKIALGLCDGMGIAEIERSLTDEELQPVLEPEQDGEGIPYQFKCPAANCLAQFEAIGPDKREKVMEAVNKHVADSHPGWSNKQK